MLTPSARGAREGQVGAAVRSLWCSGQAWSGVGHHAAVHSNDTDIVMAYCGHAGYLGFVLGFVFYTFITSLFLTIDLFQKLSTEALALKH